MSTNIEEPQVEPQAVDSADIEAIDDAPKGKYGALVAADDSMRRLTGMYKNWFLDYA